MTIKLTKWFGATNNSLHGMPATPDPTKQMPSHLLISSIYQQQPFAMNNTITGSSSNPMAQHKQKQKQKPKHYQQQKQQQQKQQQQKEKEKQTPKPEKQFTFNAYMNEMEDDNMSLYSTSASIMTDRDHPFNNSQRPLLAERKPHLLLQLTNSNSRSNNSNKQQQHIENNMKKYKYQNTINQQTSTKYYCKQQQQSQRHYEPLSSYISPYAQQQKRDSAKGLHGFNDFDILSQQYNTHLQSPHIGYPYGSPPSPHNTVSTTVDFVFDTPLNNTNGNCSSNSSTSSSSSSNEKALSNNNVNPKNMTTNKTTTGTVTTISATSTSTAMTAATTAKIAMTNTMNTLTYCDNINNYGSMLKSDMNKVACCSGAQSISDIESDVINKLSRFEDDFCNRRNMKFVSNGVTSKEIPIIDGNQQKLQQQQQQQLQQKQKYQEKNIQTGPFIFGVPPEQQINFTCYSPTSNNGVDICTNLNVNGNYPSNNCTTKNVNANINDYDISSTTPDDISTSSKENGKRQYKFWSKICCKTKESKTIKEDNLSKLIEKASIKCVLVGDCAVGKTNLILSYLENRFNSEHIPTASDIYNADVMVDDNPVHLTLCDTAGQDTLDPLRELCYPDSDVFLLCFSVAKPETFHAIKMKWAPKFAKTKAALILVGTQADLRYNANVLNKLQSNGEKPISYADAWDLATTIGAKYIETSSATQYKVKELFDTAIWDGLVPAKTLITASSLSSERPSMWKKLFCLA